MPDAPDPQDRDSDKPTLRQRLHSATGDRDAEAKVLAEDAEVPEEDANHAVRQAAGDLDEPAAEDDIAHPTDAAAAHEAPSE